MAPRLKQSDPGPVALRAEVEKLWQKYKGDLSQYPNPALIYNQSEIKGGFQIYGNKWENKAANQYRNYIKEKFLQNGLPIPDFKARPRISLTPKQVKFNIPDSTKKDFHDSFFSGQEFTGSLYDNNQERGDKWQSARSATGSKIKLITKPDRIMINGFESDINELFTLAPRVLNVNGVRFAIFILTLPFMYGRASEGSDNPLLVDIKPDGRSAKVTFFTPSILLTSNRLAGRKLPGHHHIVSQAFRNWLSEHAEKKGDQLSFDIVLDIPFAAERSTSSDLLPHDSGQVVSCTSTKSKDKASVYDILHSFILVFKERGNGFHCARTVIGEFINFSDDDEDGGVEW